MRKVELVISIELFENLVTAANFPNGKLYLGQHPFVVEPIACVTEEIAVVQGSAKTVMGLKHFVLGDGVLQCLHDPGRGHSRFNAVQTLKDLADGNEGRITATDPTSIKDRNALVALNAAPFHRECRYLTP